MVASIALVENQFTCVGCSTVYILVSFFLEHSLKTECVIRLHDTRFCIKKRLLFWIFSSLTKIERVFNLSYPSKQEAFAFFLGAD